MEYIEEKDGVLIKNPKDFSLSQTFLCGQCFRFNQTEKGSFVGVAFGKVVEFEEKGNDIKIYNISLEEFYDKWEDFLDLKRDYGKIKSELYVDDVIKKAIDFGCGIRILKQDFFECLISFIISQQNNIPKIKKTIEKMSEMFGKEIIYKGNKYYSFPTFDDIKDITVDDLAPLKIGYRDSYIVDALSCIKNNTVKYEELVDMACDDARKILLKIKGVGNKVADCVLLFSLLKFEAFPVDTWIKKAMMSLYDLPENKIQSYSKDHFKNYSGFAQQYIFYYIRENSKN